MSTGNEIELNVNEMNIGEEIVRTLEQNESLQTKKLAKQGIMKKEFKKIFKKIAFSKKNHVENLIEIHYVGTSIVLMMGKMLKGDILNSFMKHFLFFLLCWLCEQS
jgi:hypothetical protein